MKKKILHPRYTIFLFILIFCLPSVGFGEETSKPQSISLPKKMMRKFSRGLANTLTAPMELIKQPLKEADQADSVIGVPAGCLTGFFTGLGWMFYRLGTGVFDVITFSLPVKNYESLIEPEFII